MSEFQDRFVAFVDILGFSDIVSRMRENDELFVTIRDALATIEAQAKGLDEYRQLCNPPRSSHRAALLARSDVAMTAFSDFYLISEGASDEEGDLSPWRVIFAVQALGSNLLTKGILTRGAIVRGSLYHQGRIAFGPAFIEAYNIEKNVAKYPRILVTEEVRRAIDAENNRLDGRLLREDFDGLCFVNVLSLPLTKWSPVENDASGLEMRDFSDCVRRGFTKQHEDFSRQKERTAYDLGRLSKINWLMHHLEASDRLNGQETIGGAV